MRFIYIFLAVTAVILTMLIVGLIFLSVQAGGGNLLLPGLGLVIWMPLVIILFAVVDAAIIFLALFFRSQNRKK